MPEPLHDFARHAQSPEPAPAGGTGIAISVSPGAEPRPGGPIPVYGAFRVTRDEVAPLGADCLRALALVVRTPGVAGWNVAQGEILFGDDLQQDGDVLTGYFNLDLANRFDLSGFRGTMRVHASILHHVSEVHTLELA